MTLHLDFPIWLPLTFLFVLGAVIGSFLNVVILRTPSRYTLWEQWTSLSENASHCPRCKSPIRWYDNIPIFGWLKLGGRCRDCKMRISFRYPLIELLNALLFVLVYWLEVPVGRSASLEASCLYTPLGPWNYPGNGWLSPEWQIHIQYVFHMVLIESLLVASVIDFDHRIIPDITTTPATVFGILVSAVVARVHLAPVWYQNSTLDRDFGLIVPEAWSSYLAPPDGALIDDRTWIPHWIVDWPILHGLANSLAGLAMGYILIKLVREIGQRVLHREAMGAGDIYLMMTIGAFLGWQATVVTFFLAPVMGLLFSFGQRFFYRDDAIPYGPFLSLGALATILTWSDAFERTRRIFELGPLLIMLFVLMVVLFVVSLALVQGIKWLFGIPLYPPDEDQVHVWRAADQTHFFAGEFVNRWSGRWRMDDWQGNAAGRGQVHEERWKQGAPGRGGPPVRRL
ncbi:MAG: prepilin peptidase [Planctomycetaceae bacterium]|nr:prepilin peptidase [Planctomycetaceae bacterium]MCA9042851.1 prepilin peptidase [Planctomycetaceae bacterium]